MKTHIIMALLLYFLMPSVIACSFAPGYGYFKPSDSWKLIEYETPQNGLYWVEVPEPIVTLNKIKRGTGERSSSCSDFGIVEVEVQLPDSSPYKLEDFGIYFRVIEGAQPDWIFPDFPLVGRIEKGKSKLRFTWLEPEGKAIEPINLKVDVFLVSPKLNVGNSVVVLVKN